MTKKKKTTTKTTTPTKRAKKARPATGSLRATSKTQSTTTRKKKRSVQKAKAKVEAIAGREKAKKARSRASTSEMRSRPGTTTRTKIKKTAKKIPRTTKRQASKTAHRGDLVETLHRKYFEGQPERLRELEAARVGAEVAQQIYDLRTKANLTQADLAKLVGTSRTVITRLEDNDYDGHSVSMLQRIASVLRQRIQIRFVPADSQSKTPSRS